MPNNRPGSGRSLYIVLGVTLLAGAATLGFGLQRWYNSTRPKAPAPIVEPSELKASPAAIPATIPANLPDFVIKDGNNTPRSAEEWRGKSLILNFWATWCPPCVREIPLLKTLHAERAEQGFEVIGIAMDFREDVLAYAKQADISYPLLIGEQEAIDLATKLGVGATGLPFTVFTDAKSRIVTVRMGELHAPEANAILDTVQRINEGSLTLDAAKGQISTPGPSRR